MLASGEGGLGTRVPSAVMDIPGVVLHVRDRSIWEVDEDKGKDCSRECVHDSLGNMTP